MAADTPTYQRWEYKREFALTEDDMNARGRQGWELVAYERSHNVYVWKRPLVHSDRTPDAR